MPKQQTPDTAYRQLAFRAAEAKEEDRSVPVTLATGAAVRVYDSRRGMIDEHLDMTAADLPRQIPLVDSHNHGSVDNILGSIRELRIEGNELSGRAYFSRKPAAVSAFNDMRDGHLTDISVGFFRQKETYVEAEKEGQINGQRIKGPARLVTRWAPFEGSAVTVGADRHSTFGRVPALRAYIDPEGAKEEAMNAEYRAFLVEQGMPADTADDAGLAWAKANLRAGTATATLKNPSGGSKEVIVETKNIDTDALSKRMIELERARVMTIRNSAELAGVTARFADALITAGDDAPTAQGKIIAEQARTRQAHGIQPIASEKESFRSAVMDGLSLRFGAAIEKPAKGHREFQHTRFLDLARRCAVQEGMEARSLDDRDVIRQLFNSNVSARASDGQAYLTTGNFSNLLLDAQNKTLLASFMNVPTTYQIWARQGQSVPDFKNINRVRLGEIGNQPHVEENGDYKDMSISDAKESYTVEKRGSLVSLTYEAMRNDDLGGFSRLVQLQGAAMKRTINRSVYQILFDNPTLSDGVAIFHSSSHGANLVTSAFTVAVLNTAYSAMALQTGLNTDTILGIVPRYVVHAPGITGTVWSILNSIADPAVGGSAVGNSGSANIYGPQGGRKLSAIEEPILAGNDADSWYLIADNSQVDTIEYTFLQGEESPVFEQETAFIQDAVKYKVRQTWGTKCIDYRGLYKSTG